MAAAKNNCYNPKGPAEKPINWEQFEQLCGLQCTQPEIGSFLKVHRETLSKRVKENYGEDYSTVYKRFSEVGKTSLRRNQFILSKKNAAMAIWLGKQWLDQKDSQEVSVSNETTKQFGDVMEWLAKKQQEIKIDKK